MRWAKFVGNENELNKFECKAQSFTHKDTKWRNKMEELNEEKKRRKRKPAIFP